jgi:hypothetical protein
LERLISKHFASSAVGFGAPCSIMYLTVARMWVGRSAFPSVSKDTGLLDIRTRTGARRIQAGSGLAQASGEFAEAANAATQTGYGNRLLAILSYLSTIDRKGEKI